MAARLLSVREQYPAENGIAEEEDVSSICYYISHILCRAHREFHTYFSTLLFLNSSVDLHLQHSRQLNCHPEGLRSQQTSSPYHHQDDFRQDHHVGACRRHSVQSCSHNCRERESVFCLTLLNVIFVSAGTDQERIVQWPTRVYRTVVGSPASLGGSVGDTGPY